MNGRLLIFIIAACVIITGTAVASEIQLAQSTPEKTQLMQQSDYQRRVDQEKKERAERQALAEIDAATQSQSASLDSVVLVVLLVTAGIVILVSTRRRIYRLRP
ncbi:MAG: hypothetical protein ABIJ00_09585 [Candidatus Eisenbacteria bacterium]